MHPRPPAGDEDQLRRAEHNQVGDSHGRTPGIRICCKIKQSSVCHSATNRVQGGVFKVEVAFPNEYPFKPPVVSFKTKIYHPNVTNDDKGSMCLGLLRPDQWKPPNKIVAVLRLIQSLMLEPNADDAIEPSIGNEFRNNREDFDKTAKDWTKKYAK